MGQLGCSVLPHEIGHNHGLRHAPTPASTFPNPCSGLLSDVPDNLDKNFPYPNGELGGVLGFNVGNGWIIDTAPNSIKYHDIMGYWYPQLPSDYFFTKASEWASLMAPIAPITMGLSAKPISMT